MTAILTCMAELGMEPMYAQTSNHDNAIMAYMQNHFGGIKKWS